MVTVRRTLSMPLLAAMLLLSACGSGETTTEAGSGTTDSGESSDSNGDEQPTEVPDLDQPPDLVVTAGDAEVTLQPFSYCWSGPGEGVCADGTPADPLPTVAAEDSVGFTYPLAGWTFTASPLSGGACEAGAGWLEPRADGGWNVIATGPAGTRELMLFGRGPQGDAAYGLAVTVDDVSGLAEPEGAPTGGIELDRLFDPDAGVTVHLNGPFLPARSVQLELADGGGSGVIVPLEQVEWVDECSARYPVDGALLDGLTGELATEPTGYAVDVVTDDGRTFRAEVALDPDDPTGPAAEGYAELIFRAIEPGGVIGDDGAGDDGSGGPPAVDPGEAVAAVEWFLSQLAAGDYEGAAITALPADLDHDEIMADGIASGDVGTDISFAEQLGQWCEVAECSAPVSVEVVDTGSEPPLVIRARWSSGAEADFELFSLEGINIVGVPPRRA